MKYEEIYQYIGEMGRYQWSVYIVIFLVAMYVCDSIHMVFVGGDMKHWCRVDELAQLPYELQRYIAIPDDPKKLDGGYSSCTMFERNYSAYSLEDFHNWNRTFVANDTHIVRCSSWVFDQSIFQSTIVSKFNLVCGLSFLNQLVSSVFMAGHLVGGLSSGALSDRIGRQKTMVVFMLLKLCGAAMSTFGAYYVVFFVGRFLIGAGQCGCFVSGFVLVMEMSSPRYRTALACGLQIAFGVGFMLQPAMAYALRDEFTYQLAALSPNVLFFFLLIFIPESPRWLIVHGRFDEAYRNLQRMCRVNKTQLPEKFNLENFEKEEAVKKKNCTALLSTRRMRHRTFTIYFSWFTCSLIYYALSLNTGILSGNIYLNTFISGAVEVVGYSFSIYLMNHRLLGRRLTGCISLIGAGLASFICIPLILLHYSTTATVFSMIGKWCISISYSVVYVFASEIFPTEVRQIGMGTASVCGRISSMAAPYFGGPMTMLWKPLPSVLFGITATLSGLLYIFMPETLGLPLFDTIHQSEQFERKNDKTVKQNSILPAEQKDPTESSSV